MKFFCIALTMLSMNSAAFAYGMFHPPETKQTPVADTLYGHVMIDNYRWLEDKTNQDVVAWTRAQHISTLKYLNVQTKEVPGLQAELAAYLDRDVISAPFFEGNREFFYAKKKGDAQSKLYTRLNGKEAIVFDPMAFDPSGKTAITATEFTLDGNKVAIGIQQKGAEISDFLIVDTKTGAILSKELKGIWGFSWTHDEEHAYITPRTREMVNKQLPLKTYLHKIGDDMKNDIFLTAPDDAKESAWVDDSEEGGMTFFGKGDFSSNSLSIRRTGTTDQPKPIYSSTKYKANPYVKGNRMYIFTNHEAPNYRLMVTDLDKPEFEHWKDFYPAKETVLESYAVTSDYVIIQDKKDILSRLFAYDLNGKLVKQIELPELGNVSGLRYHKQSNTLYVSLSTFTAPGKLYKLDGKTLQWTFVYQDNPPVDTKSIEGHIVFYPSKDGTKIPMFLIYKKGLKLDGSNPTLLYGYGGFNLGISPSYVGSYASFINRGGVYATAGIRGGDEYGENWHQGGMLKKKQNTFDDFIAAAEYLIKEKYTTKEKLAIRGGSNGGLLIGATITQRPDLFKAAVCQVPLLDMVRFHKFLIARYWIPEYGDPDKQEDYNYIMTYSPYQQVKPGLNVPTTLVTAGENDVRVDPLHAKKFVAALQNNSSQKNPVLLFIDYDSGHGSGKPVSKTIEDETLIWRFVMNELGMVQ